MTSTSICAPGPTARGSANGLTSTRTSRLQRLRRRIRTWAPSPEVGRRQEDVASMPGGTGQERILRAVLWVAAIAAFPCSLAQAQQGGGNLGLELVDLKVLRVCADPSNMPFSNERGEGFENKLAELFAGKLDKKLAYTWYPQS